MKRLGVVFLTLLLIFSLSACDFELPKWEFKFPVDTYLSGLTTSPPTTTTTVRKADTSSSIGELTPLSPWLYYGLSCLKREENAEAMTTAYNELSTAVQNLQKEFSLSADITEKDFLTVFYYYRSDYPQHFWCEGNIRYSLVDGNVKTVTLTFNMEKAEILKAEAEFNAVVTELLQVAAEGKDEFERERLLHDALAKKVEYVDGKHAHSAYGALVEGKAVCEGYARAFQYLLYQSGIQCLMAEGESKNPASQKTELHAWNVVRINGRYYHTDLTWDDNDNDEMPVMYPYFNVSTEQINRDHTVDSKENYPLPICNSMADNYHVRNGTWLETYDVAKIAAVMLYHPEETHIYAAGAGGRDRFVVWFESNIRDILDVLMIRRATSYSLWRSGDEVAICLSFE